LPLRGKIIRKFTLIIIDMKALFFIYFGTIPTFKRNADLSALDAGRKLMQTKQIILNKLKDRFRKERFSDDHLFTRCEQVENGSTERNFAN
jgi:hypothetical protein